MSYSVKAEFHKAKEVLVHEPGEEFFHSLMHFETSDFLRPFDRHMAVREHRAFVDTMESFEVKVHHLRDLLLEDCVDEEGIRVEGSGLDSLQETAAFCLQYYYDAGLSDIEKEALNHHKEETIRKLHPTDLVRILIERPTNKFKRKGNNVVSSIKYVPQGNLCFCRDPQIVTDKGIVIGKHKNPSRQYETEILKFAYEKAGIRPIYEVKGDVSLEGGDYLPAGDFALVGEGLRTTKGAIDQLLDNHVFGFKEVVVVEDPFKDMNQMHLDTYFNIVGEKKAVILDERRKQDMRPKIRVYELDRDGHYTLQERMNRDFIEFLSLEKGYELIDIQYNKEKNFSVNMVCMGNNKIIGVDGVCKDYYGTLLENGLDARLLDFSNLMMAYGGPHCLTQVLSRQEA